uniref:Cytochrome b6-f complex subunit PetP n=1 Tax=Rhodomela confervoides TaxID=35163 RepID=A0A1Z1MA66_RHOCN|nr:cytochrome b6-f complex subunit PetP [Rhodomela confervoides]ARW62721.1 cytochrome b6-f complex subunit PetP [Rhodomela confervoides]
MNQYWISLKIIPNKISKKIIKHVYDNLKVVGYKQISHRYKVPIIQFPDKRRVWVLKYEIKSKLR